MNKIECSIEASSPEVKVYVEPTFTGKHTNDGMAVFPVERQQDIYDGFEKKSRVECDEGQELLAIPFVDSYHSNPAHQGIELVFGDIEEYQKNILKTMAAVQVVLDKYNDERYEYITYPEAFKVTGHVYIDGGPENLDYCEEDQTLMPIGSTGYKVFYRRPYSLTEEYWFCSVENALKWAADANCEVK